MQNSLYLNKLPSDTKVIVAMSGGVDSSVTAALLHEQGYDVVGITLQLYDHGAAIEKKGACCAGQDIHDARKAADQIGIPHYVLDYERKFKEKVIASFAQSYLKGETPVPCIACNQHIKFADLLEAAKSLGADALATGHYICSKPLPNNNIGLFRPHDSNRDQSYFLFATTQEQLEFVRFPLGDLSKNEVRELAEKYQLSIANKPDSQDICFVPKGNYSEIIKKLEKPKNLGGEIVHIDGRILGHHEGVIHYTIGQRRGLGIATGEPLHVVSLDARNKRVYVGPKSALMVHNIILHEINWLGDEAIEQAAHDEKKLFVKIRSTSSPIPAYLYFHENTIGIHLENGEEGVAPGQACVFYADETTRSRILGGGYIKQTIAEFELPDNNIEKQNTKSLTLVD